MGRARLPALVRCVHGAARAAASLHADSTFRSDRAVGPLACGTYAGASGSSSVGFDRRVGLLRTVLRPAGPRHDLSGHGVHRWCGGDRRAAVLRAQRARLRVARVGGCFRRTDGCRPLSDVAQHGHIVGSRSVARRCRIHSSGASGVRARNRRAAVAYRGSGNRFCCCRSAGRGRRPRSRRAPAGRHCVRCLCRERLCGGGSAAWPGPASRAVCGRRSASGWWPRC